MRYSLSPRLMELAHWVAKIPFAKTILKPLYYPYKASIVRNRNIAYQANALNTLDAFNACMKNNGFNYTLIFGSMLGAVREQGFIKHDMDIDVAMWVDDYSDKVQSCLEAAGFKLDRRFLIDDGNSAREETYVLNNVPIDLFCIYPAIDEYPYICSKWSPVKDSASWQGSMKKYGYLTGKRLEMPIKKEVIYVPFESLSLPIAINAHEVLAFYYGEDYMNPNPSWVESKEFPYRKEWPEKKVIFQSF